MKHRIQAVSAALALASSTLIAQAKLPYSRLDYGRSAASDTFLFAPLVASDATHERGIVFYRTYYNEVSTPTDWGPKLRSINVSVRPVARRGTEDEYVLFFEGSNRVDRQEHWFQSEEPCKFAPELLALTKTLPADLAPHLISGAYPEACSATIYYLTSVETPLLNLLRADRGIIIDETLPLCASTSPSFLLRPLVDALAKDPSIEHDGERVWGDYGSVLSALKKLNGSVYGAAAARATEARALVCEDAFLYDSASAFFSLRDDFKNEGLTVCDPEPFSIRFGL